MALPVSEFDRIEKWQTPETKQKQPANTPNPPRQTDHACTECGTTIPANETVCAMCSLRESAPSNMRETLVHWLVFIVGMTVIIGGGWLASP